jgi:hypothetical protein
MVSLPQETPHNQGTGEAGLFQIRIRLRKSTINHDGELSNGSPILRVMSTMARYLLPALLLTFHHILAAWPATPLITSGRWILNAEGAKVTYAGINWPGAADTMIPEGLQYSSIQSIVAKIKQLGMNVIRLTYAIELIDQIYENGGQDVPLLTAFTQALGTENGTKVYNEVLSNNPSFSSHTTRLDVRNLRGHYGIGMI